MTPKDLAATLDRREIGNEVSKETEALAKEAGLVIVFGASDDLMEFRGAINDEVGSYHGTEVRVDWSGIVPAFEELLDGGSHDLKDKLRDYFRREGHGKVIEALWDTEESYAWTYKTDIPHETFDVLEEGQPWCRGIVFRLVDVGAAP